jgi:hypothetical protein
MNQATHDAPESVAGEWYDAALIDRAEKAEAEAAELRATLERRETERLIARLWVKELALWFDEANAREGGHPATLLSELRLAPRTESIVRERLGHPRPWRRLATVAAVIAIPWLTLGLIAYGALLTFT